MIETNELISILPISLLAMFRLFTDILTFNRLNVEKRCIRFTTPQKIVGGVLYPLWIFFVWIENLSTKRGNILVMTSIGGINTIVAWWATIFVFNDEFTITKQQYTSLLARFIISAMWRWNNYLVFADQN